MATSVIKAGRGRGHHPGPRSSSAPRAISTTGGITRSRAMRQTSSPKRDSADRWPGRGSKARATARARRRRLDQSLHDHPFRMERWRAGPSHPHPGELRRLPMKSTDGAKRVACQAYSDRLAPRIEGGCDYIEQGSTWTTQRSLKCQAGTWRCRSWRVLRIGRQKYPRWPARQQTRRGTREFLKKALKAHLKIAFGPTSAIPWTEPNRRGNFHTWSIGMTPWMKSQRHSRAAKCSNSKGVGTNRAGAFAE